MLRKKQKDRRPPSTPGEAVTAIAADLDRQLRDAEAVPRKRVVKCPACRVPLDDDGWCSNGCTRNPKQIGRPKASIPNAPMTVASLDLKDAQGNVIANVPLTYPITLSNGQEFIFTVNGKFEVA